MPAGNKESQPSWAGRVQLEIRLAGDEHYRVTGLLNKDLSQGDHRRVIIERFCKVDHLVCGILLIAGTSIGKKSSKGGYRHRIALVCTSRCKLKYTYVIPTVEVPRNPVHSHKLVPISQLTGR